MNILLQKIAEQKLITQTQSEQQTNVIENPYDDFPDDPVQIYAELRKVVEVKEINTAGESEIKFETTYSEDYIITEIDYRTAYIMGVPRQATATDVEQRFATIGKVRKVSQGGKNWYVEYEDPACVTVAIEKFSGQMMLGSKMTVQQKKTIVQRKK